MAGLQRKNWPSKNQVCKCIENLSHVYVCCLKGCFFKFFTLDLPPTLLISHHGMSGVPHYILVSLLAPPDIT